MNYPASGAHGGTIFDLDDLAPADRMVDSAKLPEPSRGAAYEYIPLPPSIDDEPEDLESRAVEYCDRAPTDFVVSGPLADVVGPGRRFATRKAAKAWAQGFYGARFRREIRGPNRWAFLVAAPKAV